MSAARVVKVTILGRDYAFASQGEEADTHLRHVAELVDERMREITNRPPRQTSRQAPLQVAVLAGLELADELLQLQREASSVEEQIVERTSRLTASLGNLLDDADAGNDTKESSSTVRFDAPRFNSEHIDSPTTSGHDGGGTHS